MTQIDAKQATVTAGSGLIFSGSTLNASGASLSHSGVIRTSNTVDCNSGVAITPYAVYNMLRDIQGSGLITASSTETLTNKTIGATQLDGTINSARLPDLAVSDFGAAAIHGAALGGGFELALTCDLIIAAETAKIGSVEVGIGLAPLLGAIQRLVALAGPARAREITMLGRRYSPDVLERWGVINMVVPDAELVSASLSLARQLGAGPTVAIGAIKRIVQIASDEGTRAADEALDKELSDMWSSNDVKVGMEAMKNTGPGTAIFEGK